MEQKLDKWSQLANELDQSKFQITTRDVYKQIACIMFAQDNPGFEVTIQNIMEDQTLQIEAIYTKFQNAIEQKKTIQSYQAEAQEPGPSKQQKYDSEDRSDSKKPKTDLPIHDRFQYSEEYNKWCDSHAWNKSHNTAQCKRPKEIQYHRPQFNRETSQYEKPKKKDLREAIDAKKAAKQEKVHFMLSFLNDANLSPRWYLDTCGSMTITSDLEALENPIEVKKQKLYMADDHFIVVTHMGEITVTSSIGVPMVIPNCYYSPTVKKNTNIISMGQLVRKGLEVHMIGHQLTAKIKGRLVFTGTLTSINCYLMDVDVPHVNTITEKQEDTSGSESEDDSLQTSSFGEAKEDHSNSRIETQILASPAKTDYATPALVVSNERTADYLASSQSETRIMIRSW